MLRLWAFGLLRARCGSLLGTAAGVALAVALLAALGAFVRASTASMTERAAAAVPVDWQVQLLPGAERAAIEAAVRKAASVRRVEWIGYADVQGLTAETGGTVQVTGPGQVLGLPPSYGAAFPGQFRLLLGSRDGVLVAQQTAANLHVGIGDTVTIHRAAQPDGAVRVAGIVELPNADQLFQSIGVSPGVAPQAPPDNVLLLPAALWHRLFDAQAAARPDTIRDQLHVGLDHGGLPQDPVAAYVAAGAQGRNFEARAVGKALLANNLAARLGAVREDALYARVLFLFLGAPGVIMAALLTVIVTASSTDRRRREEALLRMRGASAGQVLALSATEAAMVGVVGVAAGSILAEIAAHAFFATSAATRLGLPWLAGSVALGLALSLAAILVPAWNRIRHVTVAAATRVAEPQWRPLWARAYLDVVLLVLAAAVFWRSAAAGYQIVLAPEGVAGTSVDYTAFLAPLLLWIGLGLLTVRLARGGLSRGRSAISRLLKPLAGPLSGLVAATFARRRRRLTIGIALTALAFAFAASTAIFNTTYRAQARVDAELTNGADVTVTGSTAAPAANALDALRKLPGVRAAEPMQHRYAYVGTDLQDLYGIDPSTIGRATDMSDAYFAGGDAKAALAALAHTPDGVLVSQETVTDYRLTPGDRINLRLQSATDHQYHAVPFHFIGVVREFPTAPKDSFLVANASYVAEKTGSPAREVVLMRVTGDPAVAAAAAARAVAGLPGVKVSDIGRIRQLLGSSLTAVDLAGLTRLELAFALLMVAAAAGLVLRLGFADRRRSFAILMALGADPRQLGAFVWSEAALFLLVGALVGLAAGAAIACVLIKLLTGVFDPPPEAPSIPWTYLVCLIVVAALVVAAAAAGTLRSARIAVVEKLRSES
jgi:putative ABC transport system permease protein